MEHEPLVPLSTSQKEALEEATRAYEGAVTADAARYLLARGLDRTAAVTNRVGVVADPFPGHERFRGFLAIPYLSKDGYPLSMRFRCIQEHNHRDFGHGKYMGMKDEPPRMFNVGAIHQAGDEIAVAEGEFDAMVLNMIGMPAVAIPGATGWRNHYRRMLAGFNRVWVFGDPDDAGAEFTAKVCRSLRSAKGVRLRHGDVTDTYLKGGADAIWSLMTKEGSE
ncbi:DNA primase [Streptomyces phage Godpower]|uniref:DNA primase n=3 Tax=Likavirus TaxID=1982880 RepID=R4TMS4_9CAUD|nr:DNA primase [Streptomyces phage Lika]YP_008051442.1 DNA primase [Streptomyces phage Sujidade]AGM12062.1 DNA primase [Streptomyces phage Lika]AGM12138.1 DNA primase [Streptomyces phage Sujidade]AOQ27015.1 DNA primase [Streptomyces phage Godpower]